MRRDELYLYDMLDAADDIDEFIVDVNQDNFVNNKLLRSAVLQKLTVIGEAASRISKELRARHTQVPWTDVVGFRNVAVHAYFGIQWPIVWVAATEDAPSLRKLIADILSEEFPGPMRE